MTDKTDASQQTGGASAADPVKGTSLWADAGRRLVKNKAAMAGGIVVLIMVALALLADVLSMTLTHFTQEETHSDSYVLPRPPGARAVPSVHVTFFPTGGPHNFASVDTDKNGKVTGTELSAAVSHIELGRFDTDGDGKLNEPEFNAAPHGLVAEEATLAYQDDNGDGGLDVEEAYEFVDIFPRNEADAFVRKFDKDGDEELTEAEFPGVPEPRPYILGSDNAGRDLLTRLLYGGRISLAVGLLATLVSFLIGVTWGATAGFLGGRVDNIMMRIVDVMYGLPFMFVVIFLMVLFGKNILLLFLALGAVQ